MFYGVFFIVIGFVMIAVFILINLYVKKGTPLIPFIVSYLGWSFGFLTLSLVPMDIILVQFYLGCF